MLGDTSTNFHSLNASLIDTKKKAGLRTEPWEIPDNIGAESGHTISSPTIRVRSENQAVIHFAELHCERCTASLS